MTMFNTYTNPIHSMVSAKELSKDRDATMESDEDMAFKLAADINGITFSEDTKSTIIAQQRNLLNKCQNIKYYNEYPTSPVNSLVDNWKEKLNNICGEDYLSISPVNDQCGYFALAMNIAQFSEQHRLRVYEKLSLNKKTVTILENGRMSALKSNDPNSVYQQRLGSVIFSNFSGYGVNIEFENLSKIAKELGISLIIKKNQATYDSFEISSSKIKLYSVFNTIENNDILDDEFVRNSMRAAGLLEIKDGVEFYKINDTKSNMIKTLTDQLNLYKPETLEIEIGNLSKQIIESIYYKYLQTEEFSKPMAVIFNPSGNEKSGHYLAPKSLYKLLFYQGD